MRRFRAILARDNVETDEGWMTRVFPAGCFEWGDGPWPLTTHHDDLLLSGTSLGRIDRIEKLGDLIIGYGIVDDEGDGDAANLRRDLIRQIDEQMINAISVEAAGVDVEETCTETDDEGFCTAMRVTFTRYRIGAASVVTIPAIEGTLIELDPVEITAQDEAIAAAAAAAAWHADWFDDPQLSEWTKLTVTDDGRVFGHVAGATCHASMPECRLAWRSQTGYHYAHQCGPLDLDDGSELMVAPLATAGGHYPVRGVDPATGQRYAVQREEAQAHYDDPSTCAAYVRFGDDEHGIWMAGQLAPWATSQQVHILRVHPPSGDWRPVLDPASGRVAHPRELIGACSVNIAGFPSREVAYTAAADGTLEPEAMVAAATPPARLDVNHGSCGCGGTCPTCAAAAAPPVSVMQTFVSGDDGRLDRIERDLELLLGYFEPDIRARLLERIA